MSTLKVINLIHPSAANNNIVLDSAGNANVVANLNVTGVASIAGQNFSSVGMKNRIINGDFKIDQRFNGAANNNMSIVAFVYVVDRWAHSSSSGATANKLRFQQNNTNGPGSAATQVATGFPYYFGANVVSTNTVNSVDYWNIVHPIEGLNISDLGWGTANAQPVTLSFWCYSSVPGTHSVTFVNGISYTRSYPATYSITAANTWQYKTITIPGDTTGVWQTNTSAGLVVSFNSFGMGTSFAGGAPNAWNNGNLYLSSSNGVVQIITAANGSFYLTGVQLEKGSVATPFEFRQTGQELLLCQRYYSVGSFFWAGGSGNGITIGSWVTFPATMRATPIATLTPFSYVNASGASTANMSNYGMGLSSLASAAASIIYINWTVSAEL